MTASPASTANCELPTGATLGPSSLKIGPGRLGETRIVPSIPLGLGEGISARIVMQTITVAAILKSQAGPSGLPILLTRCAEFGVIGRELDRILLPAMLRSEA